ncbi:MAG: EAL domain-containing protein [Mycobacteriaceae bacterium]
MPGSAAPPARGSDFGPSGGPAVDVGGAFDHAPIGSAILTLDHQVIWSNTALNRMLGRTADAPEQETVLESFHPDDRTLVERMLRTVTTGTVSTGRVRVRVLDPDRQPLHVQLSAASVLDDADRAAHLVLHVENVHSDFQRFVELTEAVLHDPLTGLPNRTLFLDRLHHGLLRHQRLQQPLTVIYLDLDHLGRVNDALGCDAGDQLLVLVAERLRSCVRPGDTVGRVGREEFALLCENTDATVAAGVTDRVRALLAAPVTLLGPDGQAVDDIRLGVSTGVVGTDDHPHLDPESLLRAADSAGYTDRCNRAAALGVEAPRAARGPAPEETTPEVVALSDAIAGVRAVYQPVVDLDTRAVVGYEALARGPLGPLQEPDVLFAAAAAAGRTAELDWACRVAAGRGAIEGRLNLNHMLFINAEPEVLARELPSDVGAAITREAVRHPLDVIVELTERELACNLPGVLRAVERIRSRGWRVAVDDVGADPASLALLPLLAPEVIKLDLRLVQSNTTQEIARIVGAVNAQAERTGALVLAEGIETEAHALTAHMLGARLGQGYLFGRPAPLPASPVPTGPAIGAPRRPRPTGPCTSDHRTPFELIASSTRARRSTKAMLTAVSRNLENQAFNLDGAGVVLGTFQNRRYITARSTSRYVELGEQCAYVAVFAVDVPAELGTGVHTVPLDPRDPLAKEWDVVVLGPHFAGALLSRDVGDDVGADATDPDRRFDYVVTYDRDTVLAAATLLLGRVPTT